MSAPSFIAIIGAGPAGLFAAERLAEHGLAVRVFDRMPSPGRKLLMAGRGGLNLTHSEPLDRFPSRYARGSALITRALAALPPEELRRWADGLGAETFIGSSGRVFPRAMKASPLLRAWLRRLTSLGVSIETGRTLTALRAGEICIRSEEGETVLHPAATLLACGGASWPRLGSDGGWTSALPENVRALPFAPSNAGATVRWSEHVLRHAGAPLKRIAIACGDIRAKGEAVITRAGLEGGAVYALSDPIRQALARQGEALLLIDLRPTFQLKRLRPISPAPNGRKAAALPCGGLRRSTPRLWPYCAKRANSPPMRRRWLSGSRRPPCASPALLASSGPSPPSADYPSRRLMTA